MFPMSHSWPLLTRMQPSNNDSTTCRLDKLLKAAEMHIQTLSAKIDRVEMQIKLL